MNLPIILLLITSSMFASDPVLDRSTIDELSGESELTTFLTKGSCDSSSLPNIPKTFSKQFSRLEPLSQECKQNLISNVAYNMVMNKYHKKVLGNKCRNEEREICLKIDQKIAAGEKVIDLLVNSIGRSLLLSEEEISCLPSPVEDASLQTFLKALQDTRQKMICRSPTPDRPLVVSTQDGYPSGIDGNYTLKMNSDGSYDVLLNLNFQPGNNQSSIAGIETRVRECYEKSSRFLRGPKGEKLNLKLYNPTSAQKLPLNERPPEVKIDVFNKLDHVDSHNYSTNMDCATILHEGLHLLGLVDEYGDAKDGYTCRVRPKKNTIMGNSGEAYKQVMDKSLTCTCLPGSICQKVLESKDMFLEKLYFNTTTIGQWDYDFYNTHCTSEFPRIISYSEITKLPLTYPIEGQSSTSVDLYQTQAVIDQGIQYAKISCRCSEKDKECKSRLSLFTDNAKKLFDEPDLEVCPSFSKTTVSNETVERDVVTVSRNSITFKKKAKETSLLSPAHFEKILAGACGEKTKQYDSCAQWAYKKEGCEDRPVQCKDDSYYLGIKK